MARSLFLEEEQFSSGGAAYIEEHTSFPTRRRIWVPVSSAMGEHRRRFFVDTGAEFSLIDRTTALDWSAYDVDAAPAKTYRTADGPIHCEEGTVDVVLESDPAIGDSLRISIRVLFPVPGGTLQRDFAVLGYAGCLDRFRFAVCPFEQRWYFGV